MILNLTTLFLSDTDGRGNEEKNLLRLAALKRKAEGKAKIAEAKRSKKAKTSAANEEKKNPAKKKPGKKQPGVKQPAKKQPVKKILSEEESDEDEYAIEEILNDARWNCKTGEIEIKVVWEGEWESDKITYEPRRVLEEHYPEEGETYSAISSSKGKS